MCAKGYYTDGHDYTLKAMTESLRSGENWMDNKLGILKKIIQDVIEYSLALFFSKLVSYTFLYWLPFYVKTTRRQSGQ